MKKNWFLISIFSYTFFILILPILALLNNISNISFDMYIKKAFEPVAISAYITTLSLAFFACIINSFFGFIIAWILTRYNFPGKRLIDTAIDLPFALPTSVAGLTLVTVYSEQGLLGGLFKQFGIEVIFNKLGVIIAMIFVSFPFVVRTIQPVLQ